MSLARFKTFRGQHPNSPAGRGHSRPDVPAGLSSERTSAPETLARWPPRSPGPLASRASAPPASPPLGKSWGGTSRHLPGSWVDASCPCPRSTDETRGRSRCQNTDAEALGRFPRKRRHLTLGADSSGVWLLTLGGLLGDTGVAGVLPAPPHAVNQQGTFNGCWQVRL